MKTGLLRFLALLAFLALCPGLLSALDQDRIFLFREHFENLDNWRDFFFPKIPRHSRYTVERENGMTCLKAESDGSASAIMHKASFSVYEYPRARWRWKVRNVYQRGDARKKEGDDYPIRIYVMFEYDPGRGNTWDRMRYGAAKRLYGTYPPHSSLSYVWANREDRNRMLDSPYTDRAKMVLLEQGSSRPAPGKMRRSTSSTITVKPSARTRRRGRGSRS